MAAPTFIQEAETDWITQTGTTKTTASFSVVAGDVLVAFGMTEDSTVTITTVAGGSLSWSSIQTSAVANNVWQGLWTATVDTNKSMTVTFTKSTGVTRSFGGNVLTFRNSNGLGTPVKTTGSGTPSLGITSTQANSAIVVVNGDWNAIATAQTWLTSAGTFSEKTYDAQPSKATYYGGYHPDVSAAGSKTVGLSAPGGQAYCIMAVEVLGIPPPAGIPIAWLTV